MLIFGSNFFLMAIPFNSDLGLTMTASAAAPPFSGGDGSFNNPFMITNVSQLQNITANLSAHYILINDIDALNTSGWNSGLGFSPIGNDTDIGTIGFQGAKFSGTFNGMGFNISDLFINRTLEDYMGLFGYIDSGASISNVSLIQVNITGDQYLGGLIGHTTKGAVVDNCSTQGNISANSITGGLIGYNDDGTIYSSYSQMEITCTGNYIGGLIGYNNREIISDCWSFGNISGNNWVGGLIGNN